MSTKIQWTDETWNPLRASRQVIEWRADGTGWHCERVSPGCQNCYAETLNVKRFGTGHPYTWKSRDAVDLFLDEEVLTKPLHWKKPRKVFVCSMTDLFGEWVPDEWIDRVFAVMAMTCYVSKCRRRECDHEGVECRDRLDSPDRHEFQVLTKRPARMRTYMNDPATRSRIIEEANYLSWSFTPGALDDMGWPLPNVWLGTSVEDQQRADERIPVLLACPAAVRFLSVEPLLGPVSCRWLSAWPENAPRVAMNPSGNTWHLDGLKRLDWVRVGGESGPGARPCDVGWIRSIVQQCQAASVPVFVKQVGSKPVDRHATCADNYPPEECWPDTRFEQGQWPKLRDRHGGDMDEWPEDLKVRQFPQDGSQ